MVRASRESVAYALDDVDTSRFESGTAQPKAQPAPKARPASKTQPAPRARRQTKQGKKTKKAGVGSRKRQKFHLVTPTRMICAAFVVLLCVGMVYSQMRLTQLTNEISKRESELEELASQHVSLTSKFEQKYSADFIADYAENTLGMVKMNAGQEEYLQLSNPDEIDVSQDTATIGGAVSGLVRGFGAILEYLR